MKPWQILLFSFSFFIHSPTVQGAACCGGGSSSASLITGDDQSQLSASVGYTQIVVDNVDSEGYWRYFDSHQALQTLTLQGSTLLTDRLQAGLSVPFLFRERLGASYSGFSDIVATLAYETLPDWDYDPIRPKIISFFQLTFPTGYSRYESNQGGLDSRGNGFWAIGLGSQLSKSFGNFDVILYFEIHRSFSKPVSNSVITGEIDPGFGGNLSVGAGYSLGDFRLGGIITWTEEAEVDLVGDDDTFIPGSPEQYATAAISLNFLINEHWSLTTTYTDQTWFGNPENTSLGRGIALSLLRRWPR